MTLVNLTEAISDGARLVRANLRSSYLEGAALVRADLEGAWMRNAKLEGADLTGALNLTREQVDSARTTEGAILPDYLTGEEQKGANE